MEPDQEPTSEQAQEATEPEQSEQPEAPEPTKLEKAKNHVRKKSKIRRIVGWSLAGLILLGGFAAVLIARFVWGLSWGSKPMQATYILVGIVFVVTVAIATILHIAQTRFNVEERIVEYEEITEYVILWNRPRWVLYIPTLILSVIFALVLGLQNSGVMPQVVSASTLGGTWVFLGFVNVLIEQFHIEAKDVIMFFSILGFLALLLYFLGIAEQAIALYRYLGVALPAKFYVMAAFVIGLVIAIGWLYGLFHYTALTPNMIEIQRGLTETSDQIKIASARSRPDTTDLLERMMGCGFLELSLNTESGDRWSQKFFLPGISKTHDKVRRITSITLVQ